MQCGCWARNRRQVFHVERPRTNRQSIFQLQLNRNFATRQPPGFGSSTPSSAKATSYKPKSPGFDAGKPSAGKGKTDAQRPLPDASKAKPRRKVPIGKIITFTFFAYIAYRLYSWNTNPKRSRTLSPFNFTPFILVKREKVSSTSSILTLASLPRGQNTDNVTEAWKTGVWSVQAMQPELQIARSYTPLPPAEDAEPEQLRLFVRKEPQGEVSSFLHRISRGTLVHLRGPHIEYQVPQDVDEVLFLAGGTGIAPALQIAHILFNYRTPTSDSGPKIRILWANRRREDSHAGQELRSPAQPQIVLASKSYFADRQISPEKGSPAFEEPNAPQQQLHTALVAEVETIKARYPGRFEIEYFVDEEDSHITKALLRTCLNSTHQDSGSSNQPLPANKKLLLVSGPEGFVDFYAGPKSMRGGKEIQGPLGGVLQQMNIQGWGIWKL